jgi:hypothetical protein
MVNEKTKQSVILSVYVPRASGCQLAWILRAGSGNQFTAYTHGAIV